MAKNRNELTIDLTPVINAITATIKQAVYLATAQSIAVVETPAKAPRKAKAARAEKPAGNGAPKRARKPAGDLDGIAHDIGGVLQCAPGPMGMAAIVASLPSADAKGVKRALPHVPGLIVTGKAKGTRYSVGTIQEAQAHSMARANSSDAPPMGSHVNGTQDASA